jgi:hypothetical protein
MSTDYPALEVKESLDRYFDAVQRQKDPSPPDLMICFKELDELERRYGPSMPPQLRHFFESKSYRKAHTYLVQVLATVPSE